MTAHPRVLVLDEPTSALDPQAAEDVLAALQRLVHDLGTTVLLAEHRLERVVQYADRVLHLPGDGRVVDGSPDQIMATAPIVPPVVELGRLAGWQPLPLSVRDARRAAGGLRATLSRTEPAARRGSAADRSPLVRTDALAVRYGETVALRGVDFAVRPGEIVALMGRNGAGKSSLLTALVGLVEPSGGTVTTGGLRPDRARPSEMVRAAGLVPQEPADLLYAASVADECREADADAAARELPRAAGPPGSRDRRRNPSPGPVRGPATLPGSGRRAGRRATRGAARRTDPGPGLHGQATADRDPARVGVDGVRTRGRARDPRRRTGGRTGHPRGRDRRRRGGVRRTDRRRRRRIARLRPQVAKVMAPQPWLTVGDVAAALGAAS